MKKTLILWKVTNENRFFVFFLCQRVLRRGKLALQSCAADSCEHVFNKQLFEAFSVCRLLFQSWICRGRKLEGKKAEQKVEWKGFKNIRSQLAEALAAGNKGSCFELLALDEEGVWYSLSITSLALSPFEAVTVTVSRGFPACCLRVRSFVVYSMSKLRLF